MMVSHKKPEQSSARESSAPLLVDRATAEKVFTRFLEALAADEDVDLHFQEVQEVFRNVLFLELRRRSLLSHPPSFLGVWAEAAWVKDALDELLADAYVAIFVDRLSQLLTQLELEEGVFELVSLCVHNFISQRQRRADPLGFAIFELLRGAVREAVAAEELFVLAGSKKVSNSTVLGPSAESSATERVASEAFEMVMPEWDDGLWMGLLSSRLGRQRLSGQLRVHLVDLEGQGIAVFRFRDLTNAVKHEARGRRRAMFVNDPLGRAAAEQTAHSRRVHGALRPATRFEEIDSFEKLVVCVQELIEHLETRARTRLYLRALWTFLERFSADDDPDALPSHRKLAQRLHIPRERMPELYKDLGEMVLRCREEGRGKVVSLSRHRPLNRGTYD